MTHMGFTSCKTDPYIWMWEAIKDFESEYWVCVILYMDDALCISINTKNIVKNKIRNYFLIKPGSVKYPNIYLRNKASKVT